jgi:hypothetical protein
VPLELVSARLEGRSMRVAFKAAPAPAEVV